jgi:hypothetical protein
VWTTGVDDQKWELGSLAFSDASAALIGWPGDDPEAGVPAHASAALSAMLADFGSVMFLSSTGRKSRFRRPRPEEDLRVSSDASVVAGLFDDPYYHWWTRGQFALASPQLRQVEPAILRRIAAVLAGPAWADARRLLPEAVSYCIMKPGVDGDVAALMCPDAETLDDVISRLQRHARQRGFAVDRMTAQEFGFAIAGQTGDAVG